jgi:hypothetical protein
MSVFPEPRAILREQEDAFAPSAQLQVSVGDPQTQMSDRFGLEGWLFERRSSLF